MNKLSIIGMGWLGLALAKKFMSKGVDVIGSVSSEEKSKKISTHGIPCIAYQLGNNLPAALVENPVIVFTIPPRVKEFKKELYKIASCLSADAHFIFISSSSVYPNNNKIVTEKDALPIQSKHSGIALYDVEQTILKAHSKTSCLRMAGLFGPDRSPGRFLAGKTGLAGGNSPINLVHLEDCLGVIETLITSGKVVQAMNVCADIHPKRKLFYTKAAEIIGLPPPTFTDEEKSYKIVNNRLSKELLGYKYLFPDPLEALSLI